MRLLLLFPIVCAVTILCAANVSAGIVSTSFLGTADADLDGTIDSDSSTSNMASIQALVDIPNSLTQADVAWSWNGSSLSGTGVAIADKYQKPKSGGDHVGEACLSFEFTIDMAMEYDFGGFWGYDSQNGVPAGGGAGDLIEYTLSDGSGVIATDIATGTTGITSESFGASGLLGPGTYTFEICSMVTETINSGGLQTGGWQLDNFSLTAPAIPEPSSFLLMTLLVSTSMMRLRSRR